MLDHDLTVWLIECNTNPCLDESSLWLKTIIPRMVDDMFKLTIDKEFLSPTDIKVKELSEIKKNNFTRQITEN